MVSTIMERFYDLMTSNIMLYELSANELGQIPLRYFREQAKPYEIEAVWNRLSSDYQKIMVDLLPCSRHFNGDTTCYDGPTPSTKNCRRCQMEKKTRHKVFNLKYCNTKEVVPKKNETKENASTNQIQMSQV